MIEYKLQPVHLEADSVDEVEFPPLNERVIEKHGEVLKFSLKDIENNLAHNAKLRKENDAKLEYEKAMKENIEGHHPFVLDLTPEQLHTAAMYKKACDFVTLCEATLKSIDAQDEIDNAEIAEIKRQIPDLAVVESPFSEEAGDE